MNHFVVQNEDWQLYDLSLLQLELMQVLFGETEIPVNPLLPHLGQRYLWNLNPQDLHLCVEEMNEHPVASQGLCIPYGPCTKYIM